MPNAISTIAILANGSPPSHAIALERFRTADMLVCCDGAFAKARALGREPDFVVGDGDSTSAEARADLGERFVSVAEQDTNDLAKAFRFAVSRHPGGIAILGATGLREDHGLGNIFWLLDFAGVFPDVAMLTDAGRFDVVAGERTFDCRPGDAVSVFAVDRDAHVRSQGLEWPLDDVRFENLHCATLNRTTGLRFSLAPDRPILLYRPHPGLP